MTRKMLLLIPVAFLTVACSDAPRSTAGKTDPEPVVLELYSTEGVSAPRVAVALEELVSGASGSAGSVAPLPNGQVAVAAPASVQDGVARIIERLAEAGPDPSPREVRRIRIQQWLIEAAPAQKTRVPTDLEPLEDLLRPIADSAGPLTFEARDRVEHVTTENNESFVQGRVLETTTRTRTRGDRILIGANIDTPMFGGLRTDLALDSGEQVVLAQIGRPLQADEDGDHLIVFVIRADFL